MYSKTLEDVKSSDSKNDNDDQVVQSGSNGNYNILFTTVDLIIRCKQLSFSLDPESNDTETDKQILPRKEVIRRLRERGEPILLFGETEIQAFKRLRKCEISEPELNKVTLSFIFAL